MSDQPSGHPANHDPPIVPAYQLPASVTAARQYVVAAQHTGTTYFCMGAGILAVSTVISIPNSTLAGVILITVMLFFGFLATIAWTSRATARQLTRGWFVETALRDIAIPGTIPARVPGDSDLAWAKAILAASGTTTEH